MMKMMNRSELWPHLAARTTWKRIFAICFFSVLLPVLVQGQFTYATNNGTISVTGYNGSGGAVVIPTTIGGLPVTSIADGAFDGSSITSVQISSNLTSVADDAFLNCLSLTNVIVDARNTNYSSLNGALFSQGLGMLVLYPAGITLSSYAIPDGVTNLGYFAFSGCPNLTSVTIPGGVPAVGDFVFFNCVNLASVTIPATVTNIGDSAFYGCLDLTNIAVDSQNPSYGSLKGVLFNQPLTTLILYPPGIKKGSYTIPGSVTSIGNYSFQGCDNLTNVTLPAGVISIGQQAFSSCTSLARITIPGSVASIGSEAFENCSALGGLIISNGVANIGQQAFSGCTSLTNVDVPESVTNIGDTAFEYCTSLSNIMVDPRNTDYGSSSGALFNQPLTKLIQYPPGKTGATYAIPGSVTDIGDYAFYYSELSGVIIPDSVTNIEQAAFENCVKLASVIIPGSVQSIGAYVFNECSSLTNVTISSGVASIGFDAFGFCTALPVVTIPASVTTIGDYAFQDCNALTNAYFYGNAVDDDGTIFSGDTGTVYYLAGTTGWGPTFGSLPTAVWTTLPLSPIYLNNPGIHSKQFGFTISGPTNLLILVQTCTNLANPVWLPLQTNSITGGTFDFTDPTFTNAPTRYYRVRPL
ncbi:MAG: leucine-rich repeat domain-containing protein [Verrucomicrobiota bacterium]|jgi:hypothetical protein